uniref:Uncharacterized protein n=1 Tax=Physcomitrium patens TaxID=3218 RepID=A0A2K1JW81_PHYPA|nr:hypothetical protein PHYPA_015563 [Physcomitrium patens]
MLSSITMAGLERFLILNGAHSFYFPCFLRLSFLFNCRTRLPDIQPSHRSYLANPENDFIAAHLHVLPLQASDIYSYKLSAINSQSCWL